MKKEKYVIREVGFTWCLQTYDGSHLCIPPKAITGTKSQISAIVAHIRSVQRLRKIEMVPLDQAMTEYDAFMKDVHERVTKLTK